MRTHTKHPDETLEIRYSFAMKDGETVERIRTACDPGLEVRFVDQTTPGTVLVQYGLGDNGESYTVGIALATSTGREMTDFRRVRVRGVEVQYQEPHGTEEVIEGGYADTAYNSSNIYDAGGA